MKLKFSLVIALLVAVFQANATQVRAEEEFGPHGGHGPVVVRPAPPRYAPHPPGPHPHGPIVRPHGVRVLAPHVVVYGHREWRHWEHPEFARPIYYWEWSSIRHITCVAEDSYGDQYPVTEAVVPGFGYSHMTAVEDDALDRCYAESGNDPSCYLATCSHF